MPFSRPYMVEDLIKIFGKERLNFLILESQLFECKSDWPIPIIVEPLKTPKYNLCYHKVNYFIKTQKIEDEDYYWGMCDDDSIEDGVLSVIEKMNDDVVFVSMKRGDTIPEGIPAISRHPTNTLYADSANICIGGVGFEQMIIKGKIFKKLKYALNTEYSDGLMAAYLKDNYTIRYEPNLFVLFNWFESGRWIK
jgi:hypothetical protein